MRVVLQRVYEVTAWRAAARRRSVGRAGRAPGPGLPAALRGSRPVQEAPSWTAVSRAVPGNQAAQDAGAQSNPPRVARRAGARGQQGGGRRRTAHCTSRPAAAPSAAQRRGARGPTGPAPAGPPAAAACLSAASPAPRAPGALTPSAGAASTARLQSGRASADAALPVALAPRVSCAQRGRASAERLETAQTLTGTERLALGQAHRRCSRAAYSCRPGWRRAPCRSPGQW